MLKLIAVAIPAAAMAATLNPEQAPATGEFLRAGKLESRQELAARRRSVFRRPRRRFGRTGRRVIGSLRRRPVRSRGRRRVNNTPGNGGSTVRRTRTYNIRPYNYSPYRKVRNTRWVRTYNIVPYNYNPRKDNTRRLRTRSRTARWFR